MYKRTFEVLAKFISEKNNVTIQFDTDGGAHADMKNNVLHLPKEIADRHAYAAVSLMMHESGHIKHSSGIPIKQVCKTQADFHILNAIEDVRVDIKNFRVLPNINLFYQELINEVLKKVDKSAPLPMRALCWSILWCEGFNPAGSFGNDARAIGKTIVGDISTGGYHIDQGDWVNLANTIEIIKNKLNIPKSVDQPLPQGVTIAVGSPGNDKLDPSNPLAGLQGVLRPGSVWATGQGKGMSGGSANATSPLAMDAQCEQQFKEILNIKQRKQVSDGNVLDTDNLLAFHTGDVGSLFKEERIVKAKKSKIFFLLDASGSMGSRLMDNNRRADVVQKAVKKMTEIIDEVAQIEGLNVDWGIGAFTDSYIQMDKSNWEQSYYTSGGTCFERPFKQVMDEMIKDYSITGKKIIIVLTDGDVMDNEIVKVKEAIMRNFNDVRALIISVGSKPDSTICKEITGDNVIYAEGNATYVIMECIKSLL